MDVDKSGSISYKEFLDLQFQALKNCEDNIEFLAKDIKNMDEKIKEVKTKISQIKERESGYYIDGVPIMKGSTLTLNIIDGEFDDGFFDANQFQPMIEVVVNNDEQNEHTKAIGKPNNMNPVWKEVLSIDIMKPED